MTGKGSSFSLRYSPLDSERFHRRIYRAEVAWINAAELVGAMEGEAVDTLIARIAPEALGEASNLYSYGWIPIVADTQVHYDIALNKFEDARNPGEVEFVPVSGEDKDRLRQMAREIFFDYPSHYRSNPLLDPSAIAEGYADWATRHIDVKDSNIWFVRCGSTLAGFTGCRLEHDGCVARGVLNGILPHLRNQGLYRAMFRQMLRMFKDAGRTTFAITTQAHNIAVQRVWADAGLKLRSVENTLHVNRTA